MMEHIDVRARTTDPETSHQAAFDFEQNQAKAARSVQTVVKILGIHGPQTDFGLRELWGSHWDGKFSFTLPSKARHWAREQGLVKHAGFAQHQGRKVRLWGLGRDEAFLQPAECCPMCGHRKGKR